MSNSAVVIGSGNSSLISRYFKKNSYVPKYSINFQGTHGNHLYVAHFLEKSVQYRVKGTLSNVQKMICDSLKF